MTPSEAVLTTGFARFPEEPATSAWADAVAPVADAIIADPATERRHGGTWIPGVDALPTDADGRTPGGPPLTGRAVDAARALVPDAPLDFSAAQLSVCFPGYPKRDADESDAAHGFRLRRDAAHVDGLLPVGPARRRFARERHAFVLGVALPPETDADAAPLVVWPGSHLEIRRALRAAFADAAPSDWLDVDLTDAYQAARRRCFETLPRIAVPLAPGEAVLLHRLTLHGVAPWRSGEDAPRRIAYVRPDPFPGEIAWWLDAP